MDDIPPAPFAPVVPQPIIQNSPPPLPPQKRNIIWILIVAAIALAFLVYAGIDIFLSSPQHTVNQNSTEGFTVLKTNYKEIKDLHEVGGKLAYAFENNDGTSGVVYDGQVVSGAYKKVGILPIAEVGGTLAYEAYKGDKQVIVWNGKEYGEQYDMALDPTDVGGKLAYLAQIGTDRSTIKQIVVWDGKEYGTDFSQTNDIRDIGGKLAFHGKKDSGEYIVVGDKQYGPFGWISWLQERDGHAVAEALTSYNTSSYVVDGVAVGGSYTQLTDLYAFVDGKFAFSAIKDGKTVIVYDGKEIATGASYESGPYNINGQLAYVAAQADGTSQLMVGGQATGPVISGEIRNVDVSKGGKVAIQADDGTKACGTTPVHGPIYLDGQKIYEGCSSNPFGFFGEKLLFWTQEGRSSSLWYDGKSIGGFYGYNYFAVVNGKLDIAAFASAGQGVEYSLVLEQ